MNPADNSFFTRSFSIKTRLTLFYGLATAVLLIITTLFFYLTVLHILHQANRQFLMDEVAILRNLLTKNPPRLLGLKQEVIEVPYTETGSEYRYYIRILDENNRTLLQTPNFDSVLKEATLFHDFIQKTMMKCFLLEFSQRINLF